jgi:hypothetical protein
VSAGGSRESGSVQVVVNALLVCVCVLNASPVTSSAVRLWRGLVVVWVPLFLVSELVGSRRVRCYSGNPIVMVLREICPPLV